MKAGKFFRYSVLGLVLVLPAMMSAQDKKSNRLRWTYADVIHRTEGMVNDFRVRRLVRGCGLEIVNVAWEDSSRYKNSPVGANISDMTIQVQQYDARVQGYRLSCMPVIRYPNYADVTADIPLDRFRIRVGNQKEGPLRTISLRDYLSDVPSYLSRPREWNGPSRSLLARRDSHVLVGAQACFLPVPKKGSAQFNPVIFNYQSTAGNPAVLAILVTPEGTSAAVIDNHHDTFFWKGRQGQRLFYNNCGQRASLTATRISDIRGGGWKRGKRITRRRPVPRPSGMNVCLLIQVPLVHRPVVQYASPGFVEEEDVMENSDSASAFNDKKSSVCRRERSDVEDAAIGHGAVEGEFDETAWSRLERDTSAPIRVTVQFYKATSNGVVERKDVANILRQIKRVYSEGDWVGSLVVDGITGRPTEPGSQTMPIQPVPWDPIPIWPPKPTQDPSVVPSAGNAVPDTSGMGWWEAFWVQYETQSGRRRREAILLLRKRLGDDWYPETESQLREGLKKAGME